MNKITEKNGTTSFLKFWENPEAFYENQADEVESFFLDENRSSTIFPIYLKKDTIAKISFLTYWVKKHSNKVAIRFTAMDIYGNVVGVKWIPIFQLKSFTFNVEEIKYFSNNKTGFCGSMEVEIFSKDKPLFTFPAISIFYENKISSAVVHSGIRSYNAGEKPSDYALYFPQTGFDISLKKNTRSYFCFIGGNKKEYYFTIELETSQDKLSKDIYIKNKNYGALHVFYIDDLFDINSKNDLCKINISHDLDVFPRFYAGIIAKDCVPTLTHSFFDTSEKYVNTIFKKDLSLRANNIDLKKFYDSAFMIPVMPISEYETELRTYAQNLSFLGNIILSIFNESGKILEEHSLSDEKQKGWLKINSFSISNLINDLQLDNTKIYFVRVGFKTKNSSFPTRFKLSLNIKKIIHDKLGTNICFSPIVQKLATFEKPLTRRWFPIGSSCNFIAFIHLTDFKLKSDKKKYNVTVDILNHKGGMKTISFELNENGSIMINPQNDANIRNFLENQIGWCFVSCKRFMLDSYYFSTDKEQVGGDHAF